MSVQDAINQSLLGNSNNSSTAEFVVVDGMSYRKQTDEHGDFIVKGGTEKVYLAEYYAQKSDEAKKTKVQNDILNFFSKQENDFASLEREYILKANIWAVKALKNLSIYKASKEIVAAKEHDLNPLYEKYNTFDINKFPDGKDKKLGLSLYADKKSAKHEGNVAFSLRQFELQTALKYMQLARNSKFCKGVVEKLGLDCLKDMV